MSNVFAEVVSHTIGGGWGTDSPADGGIAVRIIRGADFPQAELRNASSFPVRFEPAKKVASRSLRRGDIVLETSGGTKDRPTGRTVFVDDGIISTSPEPLIPASFCRLIRINDQKANPHFVYYALQDLYSRGGTWEFQNTSTGISNFQYELFQRVFKLPALELIEQQAIAEVLGALDDKIAANTALAETSDHYAATMLLSSLSSEMSTLGSVAVVTMGSSPKGDELNEIGEGVPFFQGVRDFGFRTPTQRVFTTAPVRMAAAGDILVSVRAPVGDVNITNKAVCVGRGVAAVRSRIGLQATLFHQLRAERDAWAPFEAEGTVFGSINRDQLHGVRLRTVAPERESSVERSLAELENAISGLLAENRTLAATRDALLPQLMSGKLRVRDAERIISQDSA